MLERIRFHLDEHVDPDVAWALRRQGVDITTTVLAGLRTASDDAQWRYICQERRVLITHDADFLRTASEDRSHPGIPFCHKDARSLGDIIRGLLLIYEVLTPEEMAGRVEYL